VFTDLVPTPMARREHFHLVAGWRRNTIAGSERETPYSWDYPVPDFWRDFIGPRAQVRWFPCGPMTC